MHGGYKRLITYVIEGGCVCLWACVCACGSVCVRVCGVSVCGCVGVWRVCMCVWTRM